MIRAKIIYSVIIATLLGILIWSTYYTLGGFDPVEIFVTKGAERTVIGREYIEKYNYETFDQRVREAMADIDSNRLKGKLAVVFFENDTIGQDSIHYFIGAYRDEIKSVVRLPSGYDYKEFRASTVLKVFLAQHWLVRPSPEDIHELVQVRAIEEGVVLQPYWFELYYEDMTLSVEYWAQ